MSSKLKSASFYYEYKGEIFNVAFGVGGEMPLRLIEGALKEEAVARLDNYTVERVFDDLHKVSEKMLQRRNAERLYNPRWKPGDVYVLPEQFSQKCALECIAFSVMVNWLSVRDHLAQDDSNGILLIYEN